ncbi:MAG: hypothetical protein MUF01_13565 [Bryobacterales bacterium]|nr:hypothetical protein [Bryobacterales bacterium]
MHMGFLPHLLLAALCLPLALAGQAANAVTVKAKAPLSARRGDTHRS